MTYKFNAPQMSRQKLNLRFWQKQTSMSGNGLQSGEAAAEVDVEAPNPTDKVYKPIETFKSEGSVKSALYGALNAEDLLTLLEYHKPDSNITTLQLAIQKSKSLPTGLVKDIFDAYMFAKIEKLPEGDVNRVFFEKKPIQ